ncbi:MAG: DUF1015 domain-containing protein [Atopobiaceae bacterium]|nr:DUF1015 domain-containing protein [Atopobiaceae bacterium]
MRVLPITCYRPTPQKVAEFASLPYDVFHRVEAAEYVQSHPGSFLAIDRPETAFGPEQDMYAPEVYEKAGELIRAKAYDQTLLKDQTPCFYLYRLRQGDHTQIGVVGACSIDEYEHGVIRRHEKTRPQKTKDRVCHIDATGAQTGPVFLTYRDNMVVDIIVDAARAADPIYDFTDEYGVRQTIWRVARPVAVEALQTAFAAVPCAYIADGHHRASAAAEVCHERHEETGTDDEIAADSFLAVLFPSDQLKVMAYNRVVADTNGLSEDELMDALRNAGFTVGEPQPDAVEPSGPRSFGMFLNGSWHALSYDGETAAHDEDPAEALDVSILQNKVLGPILGIEDPRTSNRIKFVGGIEGCEGLERRAGSAGIAFSLFPTTVDELMEVSDAGLLMPPKSTWFEPKLRSGLFIRRV